MAKSRYRTFLQPSVAAAAAVILVAGWVLRRNNEVLAFSSRGQPLFLLLSSSSQRRFQTTTPRRYNLPSPLFMISQKEKQRRQEEKLRLDAFHKEEILQRQRKLVIELNDFKRTNSAALARKLLKKTAHDGLLNDIGDIARRVAIEIFYFSNRPTDVAMILSSIPKTTTATTTSRSSTSRRNDISLEDDNELRELQQFGLWCYSLLEEWEAASKYAYSIYGDTIDQQPKQDIQSKGENKEKEPFASQDEQDKLRQFAIQAFANVGGSRNLKIARKLLRPEVDGPPIINLLLQCYLQEEQFQEARTLWEELFSSSSSSLTMDEESYRLILQCGAKLGDIPLMESVQEYFKTKTDSASDRFLVLNSLVTNELVSMPTPASHQEFVVTTFQAIMNDNTKEGKEIQRQVLLPKMLSKLFLVVNQPRYFEHLFQACQDYYDIKVPTEPWMIFLQPAAKARIIPFLVFTDNQDPEDQSSSINANDLIKENDCAWDLLVSMIKSPPNRNNNLPTGQPREFYAAAMKLAYNQWCIDDPDELDLASMIVIEHWQSLIAQPGDDTLVHYDHIEIICMVLEVFPGLMPADDSKFYDIERIDETKIYDIERISLFEDLTSKLASQFSQEQQREEEHQKSLSNVSLDSIVESHRRLLRAISTMSPPTDDYKYIALQATKTTMVLFSGLELFSMQAYRSLGYAKYKKNQSKEAIQSVMKDLLEAPLLIDDELELVILANEYYFSLARVAQSWPNEEDYEKLIFPYRWQELCLPTDPFETFRGCDGDLAMLLPTCMEMNRQLDERTGKKFYRIFVERYKDFLVKFDLFIDWRVVKHFCKALEFGLDIGTLGPGVGRPKLANSHYGLSLWNIELAKAVIKELATCDRAKYWISDPSSEDAELFKFSALYLYNMYTFVGGDFWKLLDENGIPLGQAYLDACRSNCLYLVNYLGNKKTFKDTLKLTKQSNKSKARRGFQERALGSEEDPVRLTFVAHSLLGFISGFVVSDDAIGEDAMSKEGEYSGSSFYNLHSRLVEDILSQLPHQGQEYFSRPNLTAEELHVHPRIHEMIKDWNNKQKNREN